MELMFVAGILILVIVAIVINNSIDNRGKRKKY